MGSSGQNQPLYPSAKAEGLWLVDDPLFDEHRARGYHPERPERLVAARHSISVCAQSGVDFERLGARDATLDEIAGVHVPAYVDTLQKQRGLFAALDDDTYIGPRSIDAAFRAAGGAVSLVEAILGGSGPAKGIAIVRPPGHHARPSGGMGFCLLNNVALAAAAALERGARRVAIVDWDVHHGNGTQEAFYADPRVLFASIHQYPFYPGSGGADQLGEGPGLGYNLNVPLSAGATDPTYLTAFERVVLPVLDQFSPDLVLVSAGFDAHARDPLAGMALTAQGFHTLATAVRAIAASSAKGRVGVLLEGGYDLQGLEASITATLEALTGLPLSVDEPALRRTHDEPAPVSQRHGLEIERARRAAAAHWRL